MTVTAITCTADRPEAFGLMEKYIARQTLKPIQHLVLDDGNVPAVCTQGEQHIYCPECRQGTSMINKLKIAFSPGVIKGDAVVLIEDDDFYAPTWIETCVKNLGDGQCDLFGEGRAVYYNVRDRWWYEHINMQHASLCSTALTNRLFPLVLRLCNDANAFLDDRLWKSAPRNRTRIIDPNSNGGKRLVVGIKAMPGKVGYGGGHTKRDVASKNDPELVKLTSLIAEDANLYRRFWKDYVEPVNLRVPVHTETGRVHGPNWIKHLSHLIGKPDIAGLEIGTFKGDSAEFLCENVFFHETSRYYCVDPFTGAKDHWENGVDCTTLETESRARLDKFPQVQIIKEYAHRALRRFNFELDVIYVDGAHDAMNCLRDSVLAFDALKVGGVLIWDDVEWQVGKEAIDRPKMAVEAFLACYKRQLEVLMHGGWQTIAKKVSE